MSDKIPVIMAAEFSEWFRRTRRVLDVTQKQFSVAWGRGQSAVSDIERGDRREYSSEDVAGIVRALLECTEQPVENAAEIEREAYLAAGLLPPMGSRRPDRKAIIQEDVFDRPAYLERIATLSDQELKALIQFLESWPHSGSQATL